MMRDDPSPRPIRLAVLTTSLLLGVHVAWAAAFDAPGNFNPLVPGYFADPTLKRFGDRFYLYATTDGNGGGRGPATVWVSEDFGHWVLVPMNWPSTPHYWAPDVVQGADGRYYLYYSQPCNVYAGVGETPQGPWTPLTPGDGLVIPDRLVPEVITLDAQFFEDRDGTRYGYWGTWGIFADSGCGYGVLNPDMKTFARLGLIPNTQARDFFEGPFLIERNGVYYLTYSSGSCHDASYRVQYAVSDRPDGEFTMGPNNPILATTADRTVHGPGHHSILAHGDDYYIVYHRHDLPVTPNGMHRQVCADRLVFERDGVLRKVEPTHRGVGYLGARSRPPNLAWARPVQASSHYRDTLRQHAYRPEYAVDDNNATLWRPADPRPGHWLSVDLGQAQRVRRTEIQFEYGTWAYQYLVEASLDGQVWEGFADRRRNTRWGSPMVDEGEVEARYLRLTVTGTEYPGLFGAVWNFKAYAEAPDDPLLALADEGFAAVSAARREAGRPEFSPPAIEGSAARPSFEASDRLLIHLEAAALPWGATVGAWANRGTLGGEFRSEAVQPRVELAAGCPAVRFTGKEWLTASFPAPRALAGNSSFTVAAWVNNPEIGESECYLSWAGRGGPDATTAQFGYGSHPEFGAVGHWGFADMGFRKGPPPAGRWQHLAVVFDGVVERVYVNGELDHAEAKMLLLHEGRPVLVGASAPGTEAFEGYLASLRVYGGALSAAEVAGLAAEAPTAEVLVHADAARLEEGRLRSWANEGGWGGEFLAEAARPRVEAVSGRLAVRFEPGEVLTLAMPAGTPAGDFTLLVGMKRLGGEGEDCGVSWREEAGGWQEAWPATMTDGWGQYAVVYAGGQGALYVNGVPVPRSLPPAPTRWGAIRLGGARSFCGAFSRVQLFRRALSWEEMRRWHGLWEGEWRGPVPDPAAFAVPPVPLSRTQVGMTARRGQSDHGSVEYRFTETIGEPRGPGSGWTRNPFWVPDGLEPGGRYAYTVQMRDALGNVTLPAAPLAVATDAALLEEAVDRFQGARDFLAEGVAGTIWDGVLGAEAQSVPEAIRCAEGVLWLRSRGTVWDGGAPRGAFLYQWVAGDFVARAEVADYAGWAARRVPGNNDGGLMVRVAELADAGPGEDLVQLNFFPIWNQGNMVTTLDGGRVQQGNRLAWDAHRHLEIIRLGSQFHFRTSADGRQWQEMPGSPVERLDMAGRPLQVGLYHASYGAESSYITFREFRLTTRK